MRLSEYPGFNLRDRLYPIIRNFREALPTAFENCGLVICDKCDGSGLPVRQLKDGDIDKITVWQPGTYCDKCKGYGVLGLEQVYDGYLCKNCNGSGCRICKNIGMVDWVSRAMGD